MESTIKVMIDIEKCIGCGQCVADCPSHVLEIQSKKARVLSDNCLKCGHCFAICPTNAIKIDGLEDEVMEKSGESGTLNADDLKAHLKLRRSIRQYKCTPVEREKLKSIIEAGRLTPTGSNAQNVRYIVVQKEIETLEDAILTQYKKLRKWVVFFGRFLKLPDISKYKFERGFLFHKAPAVILVISESNINAGLAAMSMELMAESLGLGTLYVGLFTRPANHNKKLCRSLGLTNKEKIVACLAVGYSSVQYQRSAPKKTVRTIWR
jgi:nitroreductase/NAD-dependent dihydropyrimidine dehydrogenase PreA subunit